MNGRICTNKTDGFPSDLERLEGNFESIKDLTEVGAVKYEAFVYEDFMLLSAAGIFQSNLGGNEKGKKGSMSSKNSIGASGEAR